MKTVAIFGCSWGCGEWGQVDNGIFGNYGIAHNGLTHYLAEAGWDVWNLSRPGSDMIDIIKTLEFVLESNRHRRFDILFLQTDITRSFNTQPIDARADESLMQFLDRSYVEAYQHLDSIAKKHDVKVDIIGGLTDVTADLSSLSNINVLIPSWAALADPSLEPTPVVDTVGVDYIHKNFPGKTEEKLRLFELATTRLDFFKQRRDIFWPDGTHPNRYFHRVLANRILSR